MTSYFEDQVDSLDMDTESTKFSINKQLLQRDIEILGKVIEDLEQLSAAHHFSHSTQILIRNVINYQRSVGKKRKRNICPKKINLNEYCHTLNTYEDIFNKEGAIFSKSEYPIFSDAFKDYIKFQHSLLSGDSLS